MIPDLQRVLEPTYVSGIADSPTDDLRAMRAECADLENGLSFVRRLAQGRLDVVEAETAQRAEGGGGDLAELIEQLPQLLSDGMRAPGSGRVDDDLDPPDEVVAPLTEALEATVSSSVMASVAELADDALSAAVIALQNFENEVSAGRRSLHSTIDSINDELARRIAAGEPPATPA